MMNLVNLTEDVRAKMLDEVNADIASGEIYMCPRFNENGRRLYHDLLRQAVQAHNDEWLAEQLRALRCFNATELRQRKTGTITAKVPHTAPETLAEGEFNCFYLRGLCLVAIDRSIPSLVIYRARISENPRHESEMMVGKTINRYCPICALITELRSRCIYRRVQIPG